MEPVDNVDDMVAIRLVEKDATDAREATDMEDPNRTNARADIELP